MASKLDKNTEERIRKVLSSMRKLDKKAQDVIVEGLGKKLTLSQIKQRVKMIEKVAKEVDGSMKAWVKDYVPLQYLDGMNEMNRKIGEKQTTIKALLGGSDYVAHTNAVKLLMDETYLDFGRTITGVVNGSEKILNDALRRQLRGKIAKGEILGSSVKEIKKDLVDAFQENGFRVVFNRAGKMVNLEDYSEMLARTNLIKVSSEGTINRGIEMGFDLMEWIATEDERECPICGALDGKIFSVSGKNPDYEQLTVQPPVHPNCFLHHTVKINTDNGIKTINKIKAGDNVLTHKGRYRKVVSVLNNSKRYFGNAVRLTFKGKVIGESNKRNSITITPEHPFLTSDGWKKAVDLTTNDDLFVIAKRCLSCGIKIPFWKDYCSMGCIMNDEIKQKISIKNSGENNGMYDKIGELHPNYKGGKISYRGSHWQIERLKALERDNYTCQDCGITEKENKKLYKNQGLQVHHINPYRENKCNELDNLICLCHKCHGIREGTLNKKVLVKGGVEFVSVPIRKVELLNNFKGERLYNFEVEEDNSYIADGIVSHNCRCTLGPRPDLEPD